MNRNYFSPDELECKCGCGLDVISGTPFHARLNTLRHMAGFPFRLSSATRCAEYNATVSGTGADGPHTQGAADIVCSGEIAHRILTLALGLGFAGIGISQKGPHDKRFIHLDDLPTADGQPRPWVWSY